jgi:dihydrofolate reductase
MSACEDARRDEPATAAVSSTPREFADILGGLRKVVISRTWSATDERPVISGDLTADLRALKESDGDADILLACGLATLGPLASTPKLIDEYLISVHPAVLAAGPQLFGHLTPGAGPVRRPFTFTGVPSFPEECGVVAARRRRQIS